MGIAGSERERGLDGRGTGQCLGFPVGTAHSLLDGRRIGVPLSAGLMSLKCWDFK